MIFTTTIQTGILLHMLPTLISVGSFALSSFGVFLILAFLSAIFICWRLARIYDLDEGKFLDVIILASFGGILGARIYFIATHPEAFGGELGKMVLMTRYPGLSFWGGLLGGVLTLSFLVKKLKFNFWQLADFAAVGFLLGLAFGDVGCFLGGCGYGVVSSLPVATAVVGLVGKRLPISLIESLMVFLVFFYLWKQVLKFHFSGKIVSLALILIGIVKFFTEYYRGDSRLLTLGLAWGHLFSLILVVLGIVIFYIRSKRSIVSDVAFLLTVTVSSKKRKLVLLTFQKTWYNFVINSQVKSRELARGLQTLFMSIKRRLNVKPTPKNLG